MLTLSKLPGREGDNGMLGKHLVISGLLMISSLAVQASNGSSTEQPLCPDILSHTFNKLNSSEKFAMCQQISGQVLLIVNTASQCGFTPQFEQLEQIYQKYKSQGFSVVGFPSNDFRQDRGSEADSAKVCYLDYGITFPMMERSPIKGADANPVFKILAEESGIAPKWNFYKYLIDRNGRVVGVFSSNTQPTDEGVIRMIEKLL